MSLGGSIRRLGFAVKDSLFTAKDFRILPHLGDIRRIQSADAERGMAMARAHLRACLDAAAANTEFYAGFAGKSLEDFPVMNKLSINANRAKLASRAYPDPSCLHTVSTSGSTGTPFAVPQNPEKRARVIAELKYWNERVGCPSHEKVVYYRVHCHPSKASMFWTNVRQTAVFDFEPGRVRAFHAAQRTAVGVLAYASMFEVLLGKWRAMGLSGSKTVRTAVSGAELLLPHVRKAMREFWPNARVVSRYSNMENGVLAQETGEPDVFALCWASYWFEILKFDSDEPAAPGETGRLVVTDMFQRALPMIRYDTGDAGRIETGPDGWPRLVGLLGRRVDFLYDTKGEVISPYLTVLLIQDLSALVQWQVIQEGEKFYRLVLLSTDESATRTVLDRQMPEFQKVFGGDAEFAVDFVAEIPSLDSRKRKQFVQKWKCR